MSNGIAHEHSAFSFGEPTKVIFRKFTDNGEVIALFPEIPAGHDGDGCLAFVHVGQHTDCEPQAVIQATIPAAPVEYAPLESELSQRGYCLRPCKRLSRSVGDARRAARRACEESAKRMLASLPQSQV